jgi:hypothetical protein
LLAFLQTVQQNHSKQKQLVFDSKYTTMAVHYCNMRTKRSETIEFNLYLSQAIFLQLQMLQDVGLGMSAVARLAVRKCSNMPLDADDSDPTPKRVLLYLHPAESTLLDELTAKEGDRSRGQTLRRLIATYLRTNATAINAMF